MADQTPLGRVVYERHLDLVLAEELCCRPAFTRWVLEQCFEASELPDGDPHDTEVAIGQYVDANADAGENDLTIRCTWEDATVELYVEDKLDAALQSQQADRYAGRVQQARADGKTAAAAIIAPADYLRRHAVEIAAITGISIESIADTFHTDAKRLDGELSDRLRWRANTLVQLRESRRITKPDDPTTGALRDWIITRLQQVDDRIVPNPLTMRTASSTWLYFKEPAALVYKVDHGRVDIYMKWITTDEGEQTRLHSTPPDGFVATRDGSKNLIHRWTVGPKRKLPEMWDDGNLSYRAELDAAIRACAAAYGWLRDPGSTEDDAAPEFEFEFELERCTLDRVCAVRRFDPSDPSDTTLDVPNWDQSRSGLASARLWAMTWTRSATEAPKGVDRKWRVGRRANPWDATRRGKQLARVSAVYSSPDSSRITITVTYANGVFQSGEWRRRGDRPSEGQFSAEPRAWVDVPELAGNAQWPRQSRRSDTAPEPAGKAPLGPPQS